MIDSIILFDGVCNLCNGLIRFLLSNEKDNSIKFATIQSSISEKISGNIKLPDKLSSIVFIENGVVYEKSRAVFKIAKHLKFPWSLASIFSIFPVRITDFFYDVVAKNRYRIFGRSEECMIPPKQHLHRFLN